MAQEDSAASPAAAPDSVDSGPPPNSSSSISVDQDRPSDSPSDPSSLSRNFSFSKLNAKAPEFIPRSSSSSSLSSAASSSSSCLSSSSSDPSLSTGFVIPPQPVVNMYNAPAAAANFNRQLPIGTNPYFFAMQYNPQGLFYGSGVAGGLVDDQKKEVPVLPQKDHGAKTAGLSEEATQKIVRQVEYYFSDLNLATTEHLMRLMTKDPEGYVPISVVSSFKKIKAAISSNAQLASILRSSTKLVVSDDGKKVKRLIPLTEADMEQLQSRIIVAENLPEDHCHQNLMKIFSAVGSVKMIRTCQPQNSNNGVSSASRVAKNDSMLFSNKLHAFVEYESVELAEKAVTDLNDRDDWRNGLKVRLLLRRPAKSAQTRGKKLGSETELHSKEDFPVGLELSHSQKHVENSLEQSDGLADEHPFEENANDKEGGQKKGRNRGRNKGRGRSPYQLNGWVTHADGPQSSNNRGTHLGTSPSNANRGGFMGKPSSNKPGIVVGAPALTSSGATEQLMGAKQSSVPRMPDGTRGFSMGRGKPGPDKIL